MTFSWSFFLAFSTFYGCFWQSSSIMKVAYEFICPVVLLFYKEECNGNKFVIAQTILSLNNVPEDLHKTNSWKVVPESRFRTLAKFYNSQKEKAIWVDSYCWKLWNMFAPPFYRFIIYNATSFKKQGFFLRLFPKIKNFLMYLLSMQMKSFYLKLLWI